MVSDHPTNQASRVTSRLPVIRSQRPLYRTEQIRDLEIISPARHLSLFDDFIVQIAFLRVLPFL
jgi:hypothetical protein